MGLEKDLNISPLCTIDVQWVEADQGRFLVILLRNKLGKPRGHWICSPGPEIEGLIEAIQKFKDPEKNKVQ
jgi:hypothetical protein